MKSDRQRVILEPILTLRGASCRRGVQAYLVVGSLKRPIRPPLEPKGSKSEPAGVTLFV